MTPSLATATLAQPAQLVVSEAPDGIAADGAVMMATAPATDDEAAGLQRSIEAKQGEIAQAEAEHVTLAAEDACLCTVMNENRSAATAPEPQAAEFTELTDWHTAIRKWNSDRVRLDGELPALAAERDRRVAEVAAVSRRIRDLRFDLAQLEFDHAKAEHSAAQHHVNVLGERVQQRQAALWTARESRDEGR